MFKDLQRRGPTANMSIHTPTLKDLNEVQVLAKLNALAIQDPQQVEEMPEDVERELTVDAYNFLMQMYAEKGLYEHASALVKRMEATCAPVTSILTLTHADERIGSNGAQIFCRHIYYSGV